MTADWPDYNDSQHKANAIANTGVPLLSFANNLLGLGNTVVLAGATNTHGPFNINQIGYEFFISVECNAVSNDPFLSVIFNWSDSASNRALPPDQWDLCGTSGVFQQYAGTGKTKGDTLSISVVNSDPVNYLTYVISFTLNSRVYGDDDWRQLTSHTPPGFTNANMSPGAHILASTGASVAAGGTNIRLISLYAGQAKLIVTNGAQPLGITVTEIADPTIGLGAAGGLVYSNNVAANGTLDADMQLPRSICAIALFNSGGVAMSPIVSVNVARILS